MLYNNNIDIKKIIYKLIIYLICFNLIQSIYEKNNLFNKKWIKTTLILILSNIIYNLTFYNNNNKYIKLFIVYLLYEYILASIDNKPCRHKERSISLSYLIISYSIYDIIINFIDNDYKNDVLKSSIGFLLTQYLINNKIINNDIIYTFYIIIVHYITKTIYNN